jgi:hypothetical protein
MSAGHTRFTGFFAPRRMVAIAAVLLFLSGCAHYQLGTGSEPKFSRLYIAPVVSETMLPQAQALVTTQLREAFARDGRVSLAGSLAEADAVLTVTLGDYRRDAVVARASDSGLARRFDLTLQARATLTDERTQKPFFTDRPLAAKRGVFTDSGQQQAEYQTLPLLAEELAQAAVHAALDTW